MSSRLHPEKYTQYYRLVGRVLAKSLMERQPLPLSLSIPLLKHLLGLPLSFSDLEFVDPELYKNLLYLRDNDNVSELDLDFTVSENFLDSVETIELKEGGSEILITEDNKEEYLQSSFRYRVLESVRIQLWWFLRGFYDILPKNLIQVFDYQELGLMLSGIPEIDIEDWKRHTEYLGAYASKGAKHKVIKWFWQVVEDWPEEKKARLLQFCTGSCTLPVQGFKALQSNDGNYRQFNIQSLSKSECLFPRAHTCFNKLDLPIYDNFLELQAFLDLVTNMEITGFTMD